MSNTIYRKALEDLNSLTTGCDTFEAICHILVRKIKRDYTFIPPSGGNGRKDGGRDGYDNKHNFRMACSIERDYEKKLSVEFGKIQSKDKGLLFFSNQVISEPQKIQYEKECKQNYNIELTIYAIDNLVAYIDIIDNINDLDEIDRLLGLSFKSFDFLCNSYGIRKFSNQEQNIYKTKIIVESTMETIVSDNPLYDFLLKRINSSEWKCIPNIYLSGTSGIGKSRLLKDTFNKIFDLTESLSKEKPIPIFISLRYSIDFEIINKREKSIVFFDGLEELSEENKIKFRNYIKILTEKYENIKIVISGRVGSFISEIQDLFSNIDYLKLVPYFDITNQNMKLLKNQYDDSPIKDLYTIPRYANFLINSGKDSYFSIRNFFNDFFIKQLFMDKRKFDEARYISTNEPNKSPVILNNDFFSKLTKVSFENYIKKEKIELCNIFSSDEILFLKQSSLFDYDNTFVFSTQFYYDYFIATYLLSQKEKYILDFFFINKKSQVNYSRLNILNIFILLLDMGSDIYKKLISVLSKIDSTYIFLLNLNLISDNERVKAYKDILEDYNNKGKIIYYTRFRESHDILNNISSLAGRMIDLIPLTYKDEILTIHNDTIVDFLNNPQENKLVSFSNSLILLGIYQNPIWNTEQQNVLRKLSIPLISFFLNNPLANKLQGLLSITVILNWYSTYEWTKEWDASAWTAWINQIDSSFNYINSKILTSKEFSFKLKIFNEFNASLCVFPLFEKLISYLIENNSNENEFDDGVMPRELDDEYRTPIIQFDNDLFVLKYYIENNDFDIDVLINICLYITKQKLQVYQIENYQLQEILNAIYHKLEKSIATAALSKSQIVNLYQFIFSYENTSFDVSIVSRIPDLIKIQIFTYAIEDVKKAKLSYLYFHANIYVELLNLKIVKTAYELLQKLQRPKITRGIYIDIILSTRNSSTHILQKKSAQLFKNSKIFKNYKNIEKQHELKLTLFKNQKKKMLDKEISIISNYANIKQEIKKVYSFIDSNKEFKKLSNDKERMIKLRLDHIEQMLLYDFQNQYTPPKVFSDFIVKLLFDFSFNDKSTIERKNLDSILNDWENSPNSFWRFFYIFYIKHNKLEQVKDCIEQNEIIRTKIISSMETEFTDWLDRRVIEDFDKRQVHSFIHPFINYISILYDNKCPQWLLQHDITKLCFISCWDFSSEYSVRTSNDFSAKSFESVYDWIIQVFDLSKNEILGILSENYEMLSNDWLKGQCLSFILQNINNQKYKSWIEEKLILFTAEESKKDYHSFESISCVNNVLAKFWRECQDNSYINKMNYLITPNWVNKEFNYCQNELQNYFLTYSSKEIKKNIINKLKKDKTQNVIQLLAILGDVKSTAKLIDGYLNGIQLSSESWMGVSYKPLKRTRKLLKKYIQLFEYSLQNESDRRRSLYITAQNGIKNNISKANYSFFKKHFNKIIKKQRKISTSVEYLIDFENEIHHIAYNKTRKKLSWKKQVVFLSLFLIGIGGTIYSYKNNNSLAKIFTWVFTVFAGLCSIFPFFGITSISALWKKMKGIIKK